MAVAPSSFRSWRTSALPPPILMGSISMRLFGCAPERSPATPSSSSAAPSGRCGRRIRQRVGFGRGPTVLLRAIVRVRSGLALRWTPPPNEFEGATRRCLTTLWVRLPSLRAITRSFSMGITIYHNTVNRRLSALQSRSLRHRGRSWGSFSKSRS